MRMDSQSALDSNDAVVKRLWRSNHKHIDIERNPCSQVATATEWYHEHTAPESCAFNFWLLFTLFYELCSFSEVSYAFNKVPSCWYKATSLTSARPFGQALPKLSELVSKQAIVDSASASIFLHANGTTSTHLENPWNTGALLTSDSTWSTACVSQLRSSWKSRAVSLQNTLYLKQATAATAFARRLVAW